MSMIRNFVLATLFLFQASLANAGLILSVEPSASDFLVGQTGSLNVFVYSDAADEVDSFLFDLNITGGTGVAFTDPQSESYLTDSDYVFFDRSLSEQFSLPTTMVSNNGATLTMTDVSSNPTTGLAFPKLIPDSTNPLLLGSFTFDANAIGSYTVALAPSSSFSDSNFNLIPYSVAGGSFNVSAVPEPSSLVLLGLGAAGFGLMRRRRNQQPSEIVAE